MASNSAITQVLETDIWVKATWEEFLNFAEDSAGKRASFITIKNI
jgi:hypothetical protein